MDITSGATLPRVNRGEPQSEQKLRVASLPLPARTEYVVGAPVIVTLAVPHRPRSVAIVVASARRSLLLILKEISDVDVDKLRTPVDIKSRKYPISPPFIGGFAAAYQGCDAPVTGRG